MNFDLIALGEPLIEFNQTTPGISLYRQSFGGDTSNTVIAAARQGARTAYLTRIGEDDFGQMLLDLWQREGVATKHVMRDADFHTGIYFVRHDTLGHHFSYLRADSAASRMTPDNLPLTPVAQSSWLHVSAISQAISPEACATVAAAIELARAHGVRVSYDANLRLRLWPLERAKAVIESSIGRTDLFLPSLEEAQTLSGVSEVPQLFDWCFAHGARTAVLKCGADGAWFAERGGTPQHVPALPVVPVDATGAGDCFDGSLLARLAAGDRLADAVRYANVAAALSTQGWGAVEPIPYAPQVMAALAGQIS
ncbi:sugar kinase [Noviherbaspirillum massiliense]|uniref:sugar kinase n=1 Tax=Noviherbaspirillum massiliense TaxID=1465823 RepID=UPI0002E149FE|nr:sugar kinase [Noviherbaspirillum massiliense]